jgi:hypothetical protein
MTIGPAPTIRIEEISVRFGIPARLGGLRQHFPGGQPVRIECRFS